MPNTGSDAPRRRLGCPEVAGDHRHDPAMTAAASASMDGLDFVRAIMERQVPTPPLLRLLQFNLVSVERGRVVFTCQPDESTYNGIGVVQGGVVCALLDQAVGAAVHAPCLRARV